MTDWFINYCVMPFLSAKEKNSKQIALTSPKMLLPDFKTVQEVKEYIFFNFKYKADPWNYDYYTHPESTFYGIQTGQAGQFDCDCDDYAVFAYAGLLKANQKPYIMNLIIDPIEIWNLQWCHVLCCFKYLDANNNIFIGVMDTNGLNWFRTEDEIIKFFTNLYKVKYKYLIPVKYPFD
jgi:hypothetical protein